MSTKVQLLESEKRSLLYEKNELLWRLNLQMERCE